MGVMRERRVALISEPKQLAVLRSPVRQEMLDVFARWGRPVSLTQVAAMLGRPADGLYYHARLLERSGLLRTTGPRKSSGRAEALYEAVAPQYKLRYPKGASAASRAVVSIVTSMLRLGTRDFRRALASGTAKLDGPDRDLWALRQTGWLRPGHLRRVNRLIQSLADETARTEGRGRLYAVTVLLAPLDHRSNRTGRRPRRRAGT
jgi:hypothetical protein